MSGYTLFQMCEFTRRPLIAAHRFYVDQAQKRLLSQFEDLKGESEKAANDWLDRSSGWFDPENDDPGSFQERAYDVGVEFYGLLTGMRDQTRLNLVAGMFHEWDKQLRDWLIREIGHWHVGDAFPLKIWAANFQQITEFLKALGWDVEKAAYFPTLDACRLVVNIYKHGGGSSLEILRERYPQYLPDPLSGLGCSFLGSDHRNHTHLKVSEEQFTAFSDAIVAFWEAVPETILENDTGDVPKFFEKSFENDRSAQENTTKMSK